MSTTPVATPVAWMIEHANTKINVPSVVRAFCGHDAVADYRATFGEATSTPLHTQATVDALQTRVAQLVNLLDGRPAINAGLPATYISWSQSIYDLQLRDARNAVIKANP